MPDPNYVPSVSEESIPMGKYVQQALGGFDLLIVRIPEGVYAIENKCSHMSKPLARGRIRSCEIACPVHGGRFDIRSGSATGFPALQPIKSFPARVVDGIVEVDISARQENPAGTPPIR